MAQYQQSSTDQGGNLVPAPALIHGFATTKRDYCLPEILAERLPGEPLKTGTAQAGRPPCSLLKADTPKNNSLFIYLYNSLQSVAQLAVQATQPPFYTLK